MTSSIQCSRCELQKPPQPTKPFAGADSERIQQSVCAECWAEWKEEEVRTINELRLNFIDPAAQTILRTRMLSFLGLHSSDPDASNLEASGSGSSDIDNSDIDSTDIDSSSDDPSEHEEP